MVSEENCYITLPESAIASVSNTVAPYHSLVAPPSQSVRMDVQELGYFSYR